MRALLRVAARNVTPLSGTAAGEMDPGVLLVLARFGAVPCILLGQDRQRQRRQQPLGPAGLRAARRGIRIATELDLPLVTIVDTAGADLSKEAEEGGLAGEIARCLAELVTLRAPTLCLLLGEGAGGGALAFLPADRVVAAQHAWLSRYRPRGHRPSCTAPPSGRSRSPSGKASAWPPFVPIASSTGWSRSFPTPPTRVRRSCNGWARCSKPNSVPCSGPTPRPGTVSAAAATARSV